ncbi:ribonuclease III [Breoghania sp. L-A4]|uniref:ribonuclease III n=1 Tax=Breoghania sp. L-A4 TaxID=2304600 RepID=UPI000E360147|nr:ribonuclease III [Breoghania sp. L-A4]AXS40241.1 ribonuclease III [Breoghania sp. L-A4]
MKRNSRGQIETLEAKIGHRFHDRALIERALTHASALPTARASTDSYQRLEFLGDRVLGLAIADMITAQFPQADEGELARRLNHLVRRETCAEVALELDLDAAMIIGDNEAQTGGRQKKALLGDICESVLAALYLDGGWDKARAFVERHWRGRMISWGGSLRDAKTTLQEWAQGKGLDAPIYRVTGRSGPDHAPRFTVTASVNGMDDGMGSGSSKRIAEQAAAETILRREGVWTETET